MSGMFIIFTIEIYSTATIETTENGYFASVMELQINLVFILSHDAPTVFLLLDPLILYQEPHVVLTSMT